MEYTIVTLPTKLKEDEFYCLNTVNGAIYVGKRIGKSATSDVEFLQLNGVTHKIRVGNLEKYDYCSLTQAYMKAFLKYDNFIKEYNIYLEKERKKEEAKKKRNTVTKYLVNKCTFFCKKSKSAIVPYGYKEFSTKEKAEEYSRKGLKRLKKGVEKYYPLIKGLINTVNDMKAKKYSYDTYGKKIFLMDIQARPNNVVIGDELFKLGTFKPSSVDSNYLILGMIDEGYHTTVSEVITEKKVVRLSDGTLLADSECNSTYPYLIKKEDLKLALSLLKSANLRRLETELNSRNDSIELIKSYLDKYEPFSSSVKTDPVFCFSYTKNMIDGIVESLEVVKDI